MIRKIEQVIVSDFYFNYSVYHFEFLRRSGQWQKAKRIVLNKGDGAAVLMVDLKKEIALFVKQFRYPVYANEGVTYLIEVCAGVLEEDDPVECVKREAIEETGFEIYNIKKIFDSYMSPGAVTERLHLFIAEFDSDKKIAQGGGLDHETEDIELLEYSFNELPKLIKNQTIRDAKSIMLVQAFLADKEIYYS